MYISYGSTNVWGSTFTSNSASSYGGVMYISYGSANICGSIFASNSASSYGGVAHLDWGSVVDILFSAFTWNVAYRGGVMSMDWASADVLRSTFVSNTASDYGGVVYAFYGSSADVASSTFTSNSASYGGVLSVYHQQYPAYPSSAGVASSTFTSNSAFYGGVLHVYSQFPTNPSGADIVSSTFTENSARSGGGAMYVKNAGTLDVSISTLTYNSAPAGGAVYLSSGGANIESTHFEDNQATAFGDDIYSFSGDLTCPSTCPAGIGDLGCTEVDCSSCVCYSCDCAYPTSLPSAVPTPSPTALPTPMPTSTPTPPPTQTPTPLPTPAPTPTTVLTLIPPDTLRLSAIKPAFASDFVYIVNRNAETLTGSIWLLHTSLPQTSAWSIDPAEFSLAPGAFIEVEIGAQSAGVSSNVNGSNLFQIMARTDNSLPVNSTLDVRLAIVPKANRNTSRVIIQGSPTIDIDWDGVSIEPFDSDGFRITAFHDEKFHVRLSKEIASAELSADCDVVWRGDEMPPCYRAKCRVPNADEAGIWDLHMLLDGRDFVSTTAHVKCDKNQYEDKEEACVTCITISGTTCVAGSTLQDLPLDSGYWRSGAPTLSSG